MTIVNAMKLAQYNEHAPFFRSNLVSTRPRISVRISVSSGTISNLGCKKMQINVKTQKLESESKLKKNISVNTKLNMMVKLILKTEKQSGVRILT